MTSARLHGVDTILVVLSDFTWSTQYFKTLYASSRPWCLRSCKVRYQREYVSGDSGVAGNKITDVTSEEALIVGL